MKKTLLLLLLMIALCACLAACGDDEDKDRKNSSGSGTTTVTKAPTPTEAEEEPTPTDTPVPTEPVAVTIAFTETWGDLTVGVPEGWTFRKGDAFDDTDTRFCSVKKSDFKYFDLKMENESTATQKYEYNKNTYTNEQKDITVTYGDIAWTGFQYSDGWGGYGFELIATVGDKPVRVSCCGFQFDSEEAKAVLGSLVIR